VVSQAHYFALFGGLSPSSFSAIAASAREDQKA
jgi:hypothetical protein